MKHHFGDMLDREFGYWSFKPNRERWGYNYPDLMELPIDIPVLTLTKDTDNWERIFEFTGLKELTLHEPSKMQLLAIGKMPSVQRLRITHARPKTLEFLHEQNLVEELILEYVSGFDDLTPVGDLPALTALHLENLRRVRDFSGLGHSNTLKYLSLDGTFDWKQPIDSLSFLSDIESLEYLRIMGVRVLSETPVFQGIEDLKRLKKVDIYMAALQLEDFAYLEAVIPNVEGVVRESYVKTEARREYFKAPDIRASMPEKELEKFTKIFIDTEGRRYCDHPVSAYFLGKGGRTISGGSDKIQAKCDAFEAEYRKLVEGYKTRL